MQATATIGCAFALVLVSTALVVLAGVDVDVVVSDEREMFILDDLLRSDIEYGFGIITSY